MVFHKIYFSVPSLKISFYFFYQSTCKCAYSTYLVVHLAALIPLHSFQHSVHTQFVPQAIRSNFVRIPMIPKLCQVAPLQPLPGRFRRISAHAREEKEKNILRVFVGLRYRTRHYHANWKCKTYDSDTPILQELEIATAQHRIIAAFVDGALLFRQERIR